MSRPFGSSFIARKLAPGGSALHQETAQFQANQSRSATFSKQPSPFTSTPAAAVTITDDDLIDMFDAIESQQAVAVNIAPLMQQSSTSVTKTQIPARGNPLLAASTVPFSSKRKLDVNSAAAVSHTISQPAALPTPLTAAPSSASHAPSQPAVASSHPEVSQGLTPTCPTTVPISQPTAAVSAPLSPRPSQTLGQALIRSPVMRHLPPTGNQFKSTSNSNSSFAQNVFGGLAAASPRPSVASNAATPSGLQTPTDYGDVRSLQQGMTELKRQLAISERARTTKEGEMALLKQRHDQAERELQSLRVTFAKSHTVQSSQKAAEEVTAQRHQAELQSLRTSRQQLETELADRDRAMRSLTEERAANQRRLTQLEQRVQQLLKQHPTSLPSPKTEVVVERVEPENKRKSMDAPVVMKELPEPKRPRVELKSRHSALSDEWSTVNIDLLIGSVRSGEPTGLFCLLQLLHQHELHNQNRTASNSLMSETGPVLCEPLQMCVALIRRRLLEPLEIAPLLLQCLQIQDFSIIKVAFESLRIIFEYTSNLGALDASVDVDGLIAAKCPLPQSNQELTPHPNFPHHRRMMCIATEAVRSPKSKSKPISSSSSSGNSNLMHKGNDKGSSADKKSMIVLSAPVSRSTSVEHRKANSENFILNAVVSWFDQHLPRLDVMGDANLLSEIRPETKLIFDRNTFSSADVDVVACGLEVLLALLPKLCNSESIWRRQLVARTALWVMQSAQTNTTSADFTVVCDSTMLSAQNVGNVLRLSPMHVRLVERIISLSTLERGLNGGASSDHIMSELVAACLAVSSAASVDACKRLFALLEQQRAKPNEGGHDNDTSKSQFDVSALADSMSEFSIAERVHRRLLGACVQWTDRVLFVSNGRPLHSTTTNRTLPPALIAAVGESLCEQTDTLVFAHQSASLMSPSSNLAHSLVRAALDCVVQLLHCLLRLVLSSSDPNATEISASLWSLRPMRHALLSVCTRLVHANVHPALRRLATEAHTLRQTLVQCGVFDAMNRDITGELPMYSLAAAAMEPAMEEPIEHDLISPLKPPAPQLQSPQPQTKDDKRTPRKTPLQLKK